MNIRILLIATGLATLAGGCTYTPDYGYGDRGYPPYYGVYRDTDSYDGYFYVQIIYIDGEPWYVDDYRRAHPIPPNLRSHFRNSAWVRSLPPRFGHDDDMRDGYRLSRIVYVDDVPVYVDDDRRVHPLPAQVRSRFSYQGVVRPRDAGRIGREPQPVPQPHEGTAPRPLPPDAGRERERAMPPPDLRNQQPEAPPAYGRERERTGPPAAGAQPAPGPATLPDRVYAPQQGRPTPPADRDGRSEPAGRAPAQPSDRDAGRGRPTQQESGRKAEDARRGTGAEQQKKGKATGGDARGRDDNGQDKRRGRDNPPGD